MSETSLVLFIDLQPDRKIDLRVAARAAIAWADLIEEVGLHFDPARPPSIELLSADPGSQRFRTLIRTFSDDPKNDIRTAIVSALVFITLTTVAWSWEQVLEWLKGPDAPPEVMQLSDEERIRLAHEVAETLERRLAKRSAQRVFEELQADENVTGAGATSSQSHKPTVIIPRTDFAPQVFMVEESGLEKRTRVKETDLVLLRPVLTKETNKRWGFSWPHGRLGATMKDHDFLELLAAGRLGIEMSEGIVLKVELEMVEERQGAVWVVKEYSVKRVLGITPPPRQVGLLVE